MQVLVVADTVAELPAVAVADLSAVAWQAVRPGDTVSVAPVADGGPGLLDALARTDDTWLVAEVAGPHGHPVEAALLLRGDVAIVEAARAAAPALAPDGETRLARATTYGVGELLQAAVDAGATQVLLGVGGVGAVDGGAGALTGLGFRLRVADGSGLKVGGEDLHRVTRAERGWMQLPANVQVTVLADDPAPLAAAAQTLPAGVVDDLGPEAVAAALAAWQTVAERDLAASALAREPGMGAGGGLAFGLAAGLGASVRPSAEALVELATGVPAAAADHVVLVTTDPGGPVGVGVTAAVGDRLRHVVVDPGTEATALAAAVESVATDAAAAR